MTGPRSSRRNAGYESEAIRPSDRQSAILEAVSRQGAASVAELAQRFNVTQQTIRRDLRNLTESGLLQKGFGGAFASPGAVYSHRQERKGTLAGLKRRLVQELEPFLTPNATLFVGLGTTFDSLHEILVRHPGMFVATPNLEVAYSCSLNTDASVYIYGGYVRNRDPTILTTPDESRNRFKFDIAILGASAIDEDGNVLEFDPLEVELVKAILPHSRKVILVAHEQKFGKRAPHLVTTFDKLHVLITTGTALSRLRSNDLLSQLQTVVVSDE